MIRDDIYEYSLDTHHDEEKGKKLRKKIYFVALLLTVVTIVEVGLGIYIKQSDGAWPFVKWTFILLTLLKAGYIVLSFMHLGDERKTLRYVILVPYLVLMCYTIFICLWEGLEVAQLWPSTQGL